MALIQNVRARPEEFQEIINGTPLMEHWQMIYQPQIHALNFTQTVAIDSYFFNACTPVNLACIMELFL